MANPPAPHTLSSYSLRPSHQLNAVPSCFCSSQFADQRLFEFLGRSKILRLGRSRRVPCFRGLLRIRCISETRRCRESMLARLPGLAAGYHERIHRVAARPGTARRLMLSRPDDVGRGRFCQGGAAKAWHAAGNVRELSPGSRTSRRAGIPDAGGALAFAIRPAECRRRPS